MYISYPEFHKATKGTLFWNVLFPYGHCLLGAKGREKSAPRCLFDRGGGGQKLFGPCHVDTYQNEASLIGGLLSFLTFRDVVSTPVINCAYQIQPRATPFSWCRSSEGGIKAEVPPLGASPWLQRLGSVRTWLQLPYMQMANCISLLPSRVFFTLSLLLNCTEIPQSQLFDAKSFLSLSCFKVTFKVLHKKLPHYKKWGKRQNKHLA